MRIVRRITPIAIVSVLLILGGVCICLHQLKRSAERVVRVSYELSTGGRVPTLVDLRQRFGTDLKQTDPCTAFGCKYEVMLSNLAFARIHLYPYAALSSSFWVKDGVVQENVVQLWTANRGGRMIVANVDAKYCKECGGFEVIPCEGPIALFASGSANIGSTSRLEEKRAAFGLNPGCLTSLRGCSTIADLDPALWRGSSSGVVQCTAEQPRS
jgi:hypothetical protein